MFDFGKSNEAQIEAIKTIEGPVLITAGPGTGKTYTLVQRAIYMIEVGHIKPEEILIATFTEKAAKELITRISNEAIKRNLSININDMYIGTFHSICLRFIKDNMEYTRIGKNYRTLDDFDQRYTVFQNIRRFREIPNFTDLFGDSGAWFQSEKICKYVNTLSEEMINADDLIEDDDKVISIMGKILEEYQDLLAEQNLLDFANIQTEAYNLLNNNKVVLDKLQSQIKYLMIDEYQDTNYIQEQLIFKLAGNNNNICVVGDDDQGLYRFRGATIRNILEFPQKFRKGKCKIIPLTINYRSHPDIVNFYNNWMKTTAGKNFKFEWGNYRYYKEIEANAKKDFNSPAVIKLIPEEVTDTWHEAILKFINDLMDSGKLENLNQIAFLFNSVKNDNVTSLARYLENHNINVYSPRSDMFFERTEVMQLIGCLLLMFPKYVQDLENRNFKYIDQNLCKYYESCIKEITNLIKTGEYQDLKAFLREKGRNHTRLTSNTDYSFSGLIYQLFEFEPFYSYLGCDMSSGVVDLRPARNMSKLTEILIKYEYLHRVDIFTPKKIKKDVNLLFNMYFRFLFNGGIDEYEDDSEYAPSGCASFLTIHQSKGLEFPIVIVGSLYSVPRKSSEWALELVAEKYYHRPPFEPADDIKFFDFWRLYYTAFSRAQNLLVLACNEDNKIPTQYFREVYKDLVSYRSPNFNLNDLTFSDVKTVNIKEQYSFTSHISVYENCPLQYKFYKELGFLPIRRGNTLFGQLIHQTIEDIHKAALRKEDHLITRENIENWLVTNYITLSKNTHTYLGRPQIDAAIEQVNSYVDKQGGDWSRIKEAEVEVSLLKPDYILEGKIDLVRGEGDTLELVDFKSEKKPDIFKDRDKIEHYRKQLQVYAHLIEEKTGHHVSKLHLYYTGEELGNPVISFPSVKSNIDATIKDFDDIVHKIKNKDFCGKSNDQKTCTNCDFRFYCKK